jgi:amino acid efflux transporter
METASLTVLRGSALYIGALLGPGLLLLPGLAVSLAGPASIVAWAGLLGVSALFAVVFTALGVRNPSAGGVRSYAAAGLGTWAGTAAGWCFLAGVVTGAPVVCLIGGGYVADLLGGGHAATTGIAAVMLVAVLLLTVAGLRASSTAQMALVAVLVVVIAVAVLGAAPASRAVNWTPFAPHGWAAIGPAASVLMLSFVGWEAIAPLTTRFSRPRRQLPQVTAIALVATMIIYLGLAATTIAVLGPRAGTSVPLADLLAVAIGPVGRIVGALAAVVLTLGAVNAYLTGATAMARDLGAAGRGRLFVLIGITGLLELGAYGLHLTTTAQLVAVPTALFVAVYLGCMASALRILTGPARLAAAPALAAVIAVLVFCGPALIVPAAITAGAGLRQALRRAARAPWRGRLPVGVAVTRPHRCADSPR